MSGDQVLTNDESTAEHGDPRDVDNPLDRPLINDTTFAAFGERSRVEYQPVTLLVGDFRVRLFPKYRRGRRLFYGADPEAATHSTGCRCDVDGTAAGTMLLSSSNVSLVVGENIDDDIRHVAETCGEDQANSDILIGYRVSPNLVRRQPINGEITRKNPSSPRFQVVLTAETHANLSGDTVNGEDITDRKEFATSRLDSNMLNRNSAFLAYRSVTTSEINKGNVELFQRSPEFATGGSQLIDDGPTTVTSDDRLLQLSLDIDRPPPAYPVCFSETEPDDEDMCRGKPLLLRNDVTSSEAEASVDDRRRRKQAAHVGRGRRMTLAISHRLKLDSAAVRRRCDPYEVSRKVLGFLASTVGLTCLLVGYTALGGWLFVRLEGKNAVRVQSSMRTTRTQYIEKLWVMTERLNVLHHDNWTQHAEHILDEYATQVYKATKRLGWDGTNDDDEGKSGSDDERSEQWSYAGALLFSITVITTIGYGHITPKTPLGRLATIIYAVIGIPLTLLTITQLGGIMATLFRFIYKNIDALCWQTVCRRLGSCCRRVCSSSSTDRKRISSKKRRDDLDVIANVVTTDDDDETGREQTADAFESGKCDMQMPVAADENLNENSGMKRTEADHNASNIDINTATNGGDDVIAREDGSRVTEQCRSKTDYANTSTIIIRCDGQDDDVMRTKPAFRSHSNGSISDEIDDVTVSPQVLQMQRARWATRLRSRVLIAFADVDEVRVPAWVCLLLVLGYIVLGALVFSVWERTGEEEDGSNAGDDWDFLVGCYFCFITLSTIGFGDYVPGTRHVTWDDAQEKLVLCALYLLVGLALQAMCFQLIQEDVRRAVRALGVRLGLITEQNNRN